MAALSFSLKNAIDRTNDENGLFSYGKYNDANVFFIFDEYRYTDGTDLEFDTNGVIIFNDEKILAHKGGSEYPHLGFENLQGNDGITPQPFPEFGIYLHPYYSSQREDVGVRFKCPVTANFSIKSVIQKGIVVSPIPQGDAIGYRIIKNGIEVQTRQLINPSNTPSSIITNISVNQGDIIDFIVDVGDNSNSVSDDTALEVTLDVVYSKLPTPSIVTTGINCATTSIEGKGLFVPNNVAAILCNGDEAIAYTPVSVVGGTYNSAFKFTNLDLTNFSGKQLKVRLESPLDTPSDFVFFNVGTDGNCVTYFKPIITNIEACDSVKEPVYKIPCTSQQNCFVALVDVTNKKIVGATYIRIAPQLPSGTSVTEYIYVDGDMDRNAIYKTIAFSAMVQSPSYPIVITSLADGVCDKEIRLTREITGTVYSVKSGIIALYDTSFRSTNNAVASIPVSLGIINDGVFSIEIDRQLAFNDFVLYAFKIEY